jgi:predicted neutral ceramidase superfamily lipid hydrolase
MMDFKIRVEKNFIRGFSYWVFLTILSIIAILIYLNYFGKKEFYDNINSYFLMLLIPLVHLFVTNLSNVLHLTKKDNLIALAYAIGLILCMPYYIYSKNIHINEVILCTFLSYAIAAIVMYYYVWKNFKISLISDFIKRF